MFVNNSTIARWENGSRLPDAAMILRLATCLEADAGTLFRLASQSEESPNVILVDDSKVILAEGLAVLEEALPGAEITVTDDGRGFDPADDAKPHPTLDNIRQRLSMMCGGAMEIVSNSGGTTVTLTIPDAEAK